MATASPDHNIPHKRRRVAVGAIVVILVCSIVFSVWYKVLRPFQQHLAAYARLETAISDLKTKRPPDVTREQWSYVIGWTMNGVGNCCAVHQFLKDDQNSHQRFVDFVNELERKVQGNVTIETIDWTWDQFILVSRYGDSYSRNFRPTTQERLKESAYVSTGIEVP
jgi:Na+-transporting NADH:ubiquinone oxidoreductase subunit NqrC